MEDPEFTYIHLLWTFERRPVRLSGGEAGQVRLRPLRTRLSDMKPRADNAYRRNATSRNVISEQLRGCTCSGSAAGGRPDSPAPAVTSAGT